MSQTPLKRKNHSDQQISFWKIFEVCGWPFLTLDWPDFSSVGIGKVRWGRREELLITPHSYISLQQTNSLREQMEWGKGEKTIMGEDHTNPKQQNYLPDLNCHFGL